MADTVERIRAGMSDLAASYTPSPGMADRIERSVRSVDVQLSPETAPHTEPAQRRSVRRAPAVVWALTLLVLVAAIVFVTVRANTAAHSRALTTMPRSHDTPKEQTRGITTNPSEIPPACSAKPVLAPQSPTPSSWPTDFQILNVMPGVLESQYPSVFDGSGLRGPGNSEYVVFETVHDPALETEVREAASATQPPMPTSFVIVRHSLACLNAVEVEVGSSTKAADEAGIDFYGWGLQTNDVEVQIASCGASASRAVSWFERRWGSLVGVMTCQRMPTTLTPFIPDKSSKR
jgi:hypothetical protein